MASVVHIREMIVGNIANAKMLPQRYHCSGDGVVKIPVALNRNNPDELYYYFTVRSWETLDKTIEIKGSNRGKPMFTNKFLLDNCTKSYQLFAISSEEEYRLMVEINKAFDDIDAAQQGDNTATYRINDKNTVFVSDGNFVITNNAGEIIETISISSFAEKPRAGFNKLKKLVE